MTRLATSSAILAAWSFRAVVAATIGVGLCWTLAFVWGDAAHLYPRTPWPVPASSLALAIAAFAAATWVARRPRPFHPAIFLFVTLAAGILFRIAYLLVVDPVWSGDFLKYWQNAVRLAEAGHYRIDGIYQQRALIYVPLVELFGDRPGFLKGFNVILLAIAQLAGYDTLRRLHSHQAAQAFTVAWLAVMETTASAAIPSHDLSGMALIAVAFWLNVVGTWRLPPGRRGIMVFAASTFALGLVLCLLETLRGIGVLLLLAIAAGALIGLVFAARDKATAGARRVMATVMAQVLLAYVLLAIGMASLAQADLLMQADDTPLLRVTTPQVNSMSEGSYAWVRGFHDTFDRELMREPERFRDFRKSLALSDFIDRPADFVGNTFERSERLYSLGSQYQHYLRGWSTEHPMESRWLVLYNLHYAGLFAIFFLVGLFGLLTRLGPAHLYFQLILLAGLSLTFVTLLENQPRYIYPIWHVGCLVIGLQLASGFGGRTIAGAAVDLGKLLAQSALFIAVVLGLAWAAARMSYTIDDGKILSEWTLDSSQAETGGDEQRFLDSLSTRPSDVVPTRNDSRFSTVFGPLSVQLEFPAVPRKGDTVSATRTVCVSDAAVRDVSFQYYTPYGPTGQRRAFTLALLKDGERLWSRRLPASAQPRRALVPLPPDEDGCMQLDFRLTARVDGGSESSRMSSRTEIFFPRIEPAGLDPAPAE